MKNALYNGAVLAQSRDVLSYEEVAEFLNLAVRRRVRERWGFSNFLPGLKKSSHAHYSWEFLAPHLRRWWRGTEHHTVSVTAEVVDGGIRLTCVSGKDKAPYFVLERISKLLTDQARSRTAEPKKHKRARTKKRRVRRASKRLTRQNTPKQEREPRSVGRDERRGAPRPKRARVHVPLDEALHATEREQFRNQYVSWREAIKATAAIFDVKATSRQTREQVVGSAFCKALEESGKDYVEYSHCGFTIRLRLLDRARA